jgi:hypothetical protein
MMTNPERGPAVTKIQRKVSSSFQQNCRDLKKPTFNDRITRLAESHKPFPYALNVIVNPSTRLAPPRQSVHHFLLRTLKIKHQARARHILLKLLRLIQLSREPVNQETFGGCLGHGGGEQGDGYFHGYNEPVFDVVVDEVAKLGAGTVAFITEEVTGWRRWDE